MIRWIGAGVGVVVVVGGGDVGTVPVGAAAGVVVPGVDGGPDGDGRAVDGAGASGADADGVRAGGRSANGADGLVGTGVVDGVGGAARIVGPSPEGAAGRAAGAGEAPSPLSDVARAEVGAAARAVAAVAASTGCGSVARGSTAGRGATGATKRSGGGEPGRAGGEGSSGTGGSGASKVAPVAAGRVLPR